MTLDGEVVAWFTAIAVVAGALPGGGLGCLASPDACRRKQESMPSAMGRSRWRDTVGNRVGSVIRKGIGISVAASLVLLLAPGVASASNASKSGPVRFQGPTHPVRNGTTVDVFTLDSQTCATLGAGAGCTLTASTTVTTAAAPAITGGKGTIVPMSLTGCVAFDATLNYGWMGITLMSDRITVPMCWNGATSWRNGAVGPDCYVYPPPGYSFGLDWCGMYNNNTTRTQAGDNWHISSTWSTTYFWARVNFTGGSNLPGPLGGLGYYWTGG